MSLQESTAQCEHLSVTTTQIKKQYYQDTGTPVMLPPATTPSLGPKITSLDILLLLFLTFQHYLNELIIKYSYAWLLVLITVCL